MFSEHDAVVALTRLSNRTQVATRGTVLLVLDEDEHIYEVEFFDEQGNCIELLTIRGNTIRHL